LKRNTQGLSDTDFEYFLSQFVDMTANILRKKPHEDYVNTLYWLNHDREPGLTCLTDDSDPETIPDAIDHHDEMMKVCAGFGVELFGKNGQWPLALIFAGEGYGCISFWACTLDKRTRAAMLPVTKSKNGRMVPGQPTTAECPNIERNLAACVYKSAWDSR
jgi:hypothetical protein